MQAWWVWKTNAWTISGSPSLSSPGRFVRICRWMAIYHQNIKNHRAEMSPAWWIGLLKPLLPTSQLQRIPFFLWAQQPVPNFITHIRLCSVIKKLMCESYLEEKWIKVKTKNLTNFLISTVFIRQQNFLRKLKYYSLIIEESNWEIIFL